MLLCQYYLLLLSQHVTSAPLIVVIEKYSTIYCTQHRNYYTTTFVHVPQKYFLPKYKYREISIKYNLSSTKIAIFYTEILTGKVVLWCFFLSETSEKIHNSTFEVKISVQNVIFSNEMEKKPRYYTYFSIEFGIIHFQLQFNFSSQYLSIERNYFK